MSNRYVILFSVAEVFLIAFGIQAIHNPKLQKLAGVLWLIFVVAFNFWYPDKHAKVDIRSTIQQINAVKTKPMW